MVTGHHRQKPSHGNRQKAPSLSQKWFSVEAHQRPWGDRVRTAQHSIPRSVTWHSTVGGQVAPRNGVSVQIQWHCPVIPALQGWGQRSTNLRPAWARWWDLISWGGGACSFDSTIKGNSTTKTTHSSRDNRPCSAPRFHSMASEGLFTWSGCMLSFTLHDADRLQCGNNPDLGGKTWGGDLNLRCPARGWIAEVHKLLTGKHQVT